MSNLIEIKLERMLMHPAQDGVYLESKINKNYRMHAFGWYEVIEQEIDPDFFQLAISSVVCHCDVLRLALDNDTGSLPVFSTEVKDDNFSFEFVDLSHESEDIDLLKERAESWMGDQFEMPMDCFRGARVNFALLRLSAERHYLFARCNHLFIDGLGLYRLYEYIHRAYDDLLVPKASEWLSELPLFQDESDQAQDYLVSSRYSKDEAYWKQFVSSNVSTKGFCRVFKMVTFFFSIYADSR